ncbi:MAG: trypsin-like peptidase domain-containing protein [Sandaracinaceae bacterium]|nr:trypsin-like peptidase domain-containing protein [Sandaracinaceae bacterium]
MVKSPQRTTRAAPGLAALMAMVALALGAPAAAQAPSPADARAHFERGVRHASDGAWADALAAFERSYALAPRARTLFNVAVALDHLERGEACVDALERLLSRDDVDHDDRAEAEALRERWRARLAATRPAIRAEPEGVRLRALDRATVRLIALRGAELVGARDASLPTVVPRAAHGSAVLVGEGWALTARHVVEGADRLVALLPGETRAVAARVAWLDRERDLAFVRLSEPAEAALALAPPPTLVLGQAIEASGYPLDAAERWPNASAGHVGRPLNDGRVQLSIALNPGNSGGPVVADGRLLGIVSQGGDPGRGVQGVVVMEPIGPVVEVLASLMASAAPSPELDPSDEVLVELVGAAGAPAAARRVARLRLAAAAPAADARGALWALEAEALRRAILAEAAVRLATSLAPDTRALYDEASALASRFATDVAADASLRGRYEALTGLAAPVRRGDWECGLGGVCVQRLEPVAPGRGLPFDLTLALGLAADDRQGASFVEGGTFSVLTLAQLGNWGMLDPARFNVIVGGEVSVGSWRSELLLDGLADLGVRLSLGAPDDVAITMTLVYTPGVVFAESRWSFAYLGYRAMIALDVRDRFGVGLSWRELGRGAGDTQRSLELYVSFGIGP